MNDKLDTAYDIILMSVTAISFVAAIIFLTSATVDMLSGIEAVRNKIWNAVILIGLGLFLSTFIIWVKAWSK